LLLRANFAIPVRGGPVFFQRFSLTPVKATISTQFFKKKKKKNQKTKKPKNQKIKKPKNKTKTKKEN